MLIMRSSLEDAEACIQWAEVILKQKQILDNILSGTELVEQPTSTTLRKSSSSNIPSSMLSTESNYLV